MKIFRGRNFLSNGVLEVKVGAKGEDERGVEVRQSAAQRGAAQRNTQHSHRTAPTQCFMAACFSKSPLLEFFFSSILRGQHSCELQINFIFQNHKFFNMFGYK